MCINGHDFFRSYNYIYNINLICEIENNKYSWHWLALVNKKTTEPLLQLMLELDSLTSFWSILVFESSASWEWELEFRLVNEW